MLLLDRYLCFYCRLHLSVGHFMGKDLGQDLDLGWRSVFSRGSICLALLVRRILGKASDSY